MLHIDPCALSLGIPTVSKILKDLSNYTIFLQYFRCFVFSFHSTCTDVITQSVCQKLKKIEKTSPIYSISFHLNAVTKCVDIFYVPGGLRQLFFSKVSIFQYHNQIHNCFETALIKVSILLERAAEAVQKSRLIPHTNRGIVTAGHAGRSISKQRPSGGSISCPNVYTTLTESKANLS